ncbi:hypothetical protein [Nocardia sp. NPDC019395]|uniref:hypothetical protein n=1 Tax=Nocardia sp. NPDC019395 TaxID=3154686 RepID=UPI003408B124
MNTEVIPPDERRDMVRRLLALCHIVNELVDLAEAESAGSGSAASTALRGHSLRIQTGLRDTVVDLVANGRAGHSGAA